MANGWKVFWRELVGRPISRSFGFLLGVVSFSVMASVAGHAFKAFLRWITNG